MAKKINIISLIVIILVFAATTAWADRSCPKREFDPGLLVKRLAERERIDILHAEASSEGWVWVEFERSDEQYPMTVDIIANTTLRGQRGKIMYLVAPSGLNFRSTFLAPAGRNLAHYMRQNGYIVVGITFREDKVPASEAGAFLADWGLAKHRDDLASVVKMIGRVLPLRFDMLGQASSAVCIMNFAAGYRGFLDRIILLDTDSFDPAVYPDKVGYARTTYDALTGLMDNGLYADSFTNDVKSLTMAGVLYPEIDSGVSRGVIGLPGNFTYRGLLHFSFIYTASLPGIHTPVTGLPGEWVMKKGIAAGFYNFNADPLLDDCALTRTDVNDVLAGISLIGSGVSPVALNRDVYGILSLVNTGCSIDWNGIREEVVMVNGEYSSGDQTYYATLIRENGNRDVSVTVVPDYAYLDLLYGREADHDVWPYFLED